MPQLKTRIRRPAPVSESLQQIGDRIRKARTEAGLSQAQLGAPHFTRAYVSAIELGKVRPAMKSLEFMADKLGKPTAYFMEDEVADRRRREHAAAIARSGQLVSQGKASDAITLLEPLLKNAATPAERAILQRALGRAYTQGRRPAEAIDVLNQALKFFTTATDIEQIARTRSQLGAAMLEMRTYAEAQQELESALAYMSRAEVKDPLLKAHAIYNLGVSFYMRGDYQAASQQFERAQREGSDVADLRWQAGLFAGMGMSYLELRDFEAAVAYLRKSEVLFDAIDNQSWAIETRFRAATSLRALGQRSKAEELLTSAYESAQAAGAERLVLEIQSHRGAYWSEDGRPKEGIAAALEAATRAEKFADPLLSVATQLNLARALRSTEPKRAEKILRALVVGPEQTSGLPYAEVYHELSELLSQGGLAEEALKYSRKAYQAERRKYGG